MPPFVGVAVNVTLVPVQMVVPVLAPIEIAGVRTGFTVIAIAFDVAVVGLAQVALLVSTQVTICPLVNVVVVNVALFVPTFDPFTFHWYASSEARRVGIDCRFRRVPAQ